MKGAVEVSLVEIGRRLAQYLVGLTKLADLTLQGIHLLGQIARQACSFPGIDLGLLQPSMQRRVADLD
uniref:Uncharacterized protein n=1 Tax=Agrobacterium tumefaciens TaxID=358 RepID=A0A2Z2PVF6_AGRTU|nr:hypothetical protein [Agrobacterium radiobacter]